ncbi:MAG: hypothetical protein HKN76_14715 [Saprospiraceae bacterium]|nr:hypothetical protein [Saprospiraceae bacterium]
MKNEFIRHALATISYRFSKSVAYRDADFGNFSLGSGSRSPNEIISHMYSVLHWTAGLLEDKRKQETGSAKLTLEMEINRLIFEINHLDKVLSKKELDMETTKRILQGPFSDALTHIGQISMLSRLNNRPIEAEDFSSAPIKTGLTNYH